MKYLIIKILQMTNNFSMSISWTCSDTELRGTKLETRKRERDGDKREREEWRQEREGGMVLL